MKQVFDVLEEIRELAAEYFYGNERKPETVSLSRGDYRRMMEIRSLRACADDVGGGFGPIREIATPFGSMRVLIDETLQDTNVKIA